MRLCIYGSLYLLIIQSSKALSQFFPTEDAVSVVSIRFKIQSQT